MDLVCPSPRFSKATKHYFLMLLEISISVWLSPQFLLVNLVNHHFFLALQVFRPILMNIPDFLVESGDISGFGLRSASTPPSCCKLYLMKPRWTLDYTSRWQMAPWSSNGLTQVVLRCIQPSIFRGKGNMTYQQHHFCFNCNISLRKMKQNMLHQSCGFLLLLFFSQKSSTDLAKSMVFPSLQWCHGEVGLGFSSPG